MLAEKRSALRDAAREKCQILRQVRKVHFLQFRQRLGAIPLKGLPDHIGIGSRVVARIA